MKTTFPKSFSTVIIGIVLLVVTVAQSLAAPRPNTRLIVDRVNDNQMANVAAQGINTAIIRLSYNINNKPGYPVASWRATLDASVAAGLDVIVWPSDWAHPRPESICGHESPFPKTDDGDIRGILPMLDVLVTYPNVIGIVVAHEATSNCPMTVREMTGLYDQIVAYTVSKGRRLEIWHYTGVNKLTTYPGTYNKETLPAMLDGMIAYKFCKDRVDNPCSGLPAKVKADRAKLDLWGLSDQITYVFLMATYKAEYAPYNVRQTLPEAEAFAKTIIDTGAIDGFGFYTYQADWWEDLYDWREMYPLIPWVRDYIQNGATITPNPPTMTRTPTRTPGAPASTPTPTRTPAPPTVTPMAACLKVYENENLYILVCDK